MMARFTPHYGAIRENTCNLRISRDEGKSWIGPYIIDTVWGAYPSTVELKDGSVLAIYYTDEAGSEVRALRFSVPPDIQPLSLDQSIA